MSDEKMGATGKFPDGKIDDTDEGELAFIVSHDRDGYVHIKFGKPVTWLAMPPRVADELGRALLVHVHAARTGQ